MTMCDVKGFTGNKKPTNNNRPTVQFPSALQSFTVSPNSE